MNESHYNKASTAKKKKKTLLEEPGVPLHIINKELSVCVTQSEKHIRFVSSQLPA